MSTNHRYQVMPELSPEEYAGLKADIAIHGVKYRIHVDEEDITLDGHARRRACEELGIDCPKEVIPGLTDAQKREHAWQVNLTRRHLSKAQKRQIAGTLWREGWTQERIAHALGVSQPTIVNWLPQVINSDDLANFPTVEGKDGKRQPRVKGRRRAAPQPEGSSRPGTPLRPDADARSARALEQQETPQPRGAHSETWSPSEEPIAAADVHEPPELPPPVTDGMQTSTKEQPSSALGSGQVPPAEGDAEAYWMGALQDLFIGVERLDAQGDLPRLSRRWGLETKAWCGTKIRRMREILGTWEEAVGAEVGEAMDRNGHDVDVTPPPDSSSIADEAQEHENGELVTVSSAEEPVGDVAESSQPLVQVDGEGKPPTAFSKPAQAVDRKGSPARTRTRHSKQAVANGHASGAPLQTAPDHPPPEGSQSQKEGGTIGNPGPHHDEDAVEPDADAARPLGASAPADNADSASVDLTRCGWCGGTQFLAMSKELGHIFCECRSVYSPRHRRWSPGVESMRQSPPASIPVTPA
jgi:ParB-like chromosome segregation protein Spo0J